MLALLCPRSNRKTPTSNPQNPTSRSLPNSMASPIATNFSRRSFLSQTGIGFGSAALTSLLARDLARGTTNPSQKSRPYLTGKAKVKRVIFLCMAGGPSHLETFDYKPKLDELNGQPMPRVLHQRPAHRPAPGPATQGPGTPHQIRETRKKRPGHLRLSAFSSKDGR